MSRRDSERSIGRHGGLRSTRLVTAGQSCWSAFATSVKILQAGSLKLSRVYYGAHARSRMDLDWFCGR